MLKLAADFCLPLTALGASKMNEITQLRKLMESFDNEATLKEDWGSSDWYGVLKSMDEYIDRNGLSPDTIRDAAKHEAEFHYASMGYDTPEDAEDRVIDAWMRMSDRGQQLAKMFAPKESVGEEAEAVTEERSFDIKEYRAMLKAILSMLQDAVDEHANLEFEHGIGGVSSRASYHVDQLEKIIGAVHHSVNELKQKISTY